MAGLTARANAQDGRTVDAAIGSATEDLPVAHIAGHEVAVVAFAPIAH
jgi:hypothetical protein